MTQAQVADLLNKSELAHPSSLLFMFVLLFELDNRAVQMLPNQLPHLAKHGGRKLLQVMWFWSVEEGKSSAVETKAGFMSILCRQPFLCGVRGLQFSSLVF